MSTHQTMSSADAAWLRMDSATNSMVITSVLLFDEPLDWDVMRATFVERVVERFPRFRRRAVEQPPPLGPCWEDDPNFDADLHFHHIALPAPGDRVALQDLVSDIASSPLDHTRPLWQTYLVDGYGNGCAVISRIHHAVADGIALVRVMMQMTDSEQTATHRRPPPAAARVRSPLGRAASATRGVAGAVLHEGIDSVLHPRHVADLAAGAVREVAGDSQALAKILSAGADPDSALRGPLGPAKRVAWSAPLPLSRIKSCGKALDATVNDVLCAAVAGALSRYLQSAGTPADEVHAMVPFNLRPLDEPLESDLGNKFGLILLALPTGDEQPAARVRRMKATMDAVKRSREPAVAYGILSVMGLAPATVEQRLIDMFSSKASLVLTNVPGPRERVYVAGVPLAGSLVWAPCSGSVSTSVSVLSYAGTVRVGFLTDAGLVPDPEAIASAFEQELADLHREVRRRKTREGSPA